MTIDHTLRIGYAGLGTMGAAMAANLLKAGHPLSVWNRTAQKCEPLVQAGATHAATLRDLAAQSDIVCINVSDTPDVEAVIDGLLPGAKAGTIFVDHSTISPDATRDLARRCLEHDVILLDAPVSGGDIGAKNGTLSIMVGGDPAAFERARPILASMGKTIVHLGPSGSGQVCKSANQIAVLATLNAVVEAIAFAQRSGLDPLKMIEVVSGGAGGSWQLANIGPKIVSDDFAPGFTIQLALKDLGIVLAAGEKLGLSLEATQLVRTRFEAIDPKLATQAIKLAMTP